MIHRLGKDVGSTAAVRVADLILTCAGKFRAWRESRELESIPNDVRKDMGWRTR